MKNTLRNNANVPQNIEGVTRTTAGEVLGNKAVIEMVAPSSGSKPDLLLWDGRNATISPRVEYEGRTYEAPEIDTSIRGALRLPVGYSDYASTRKLFTSVASLFTSCLALGERDSSLLTYWALSTHFVDLLPSAPGLLISGSDTFLGLDLLRLLSSVSRRPLMLGEITPTALHSLPLHLHPTLLVAQPGLTSRMAALLQTSSHRGLYFPGRFGKVLDFYGAKAILVGANSADHFAGGEAIHLSLGQSHSALLSDVRLNEIGATFQPQLLSYRLRTWRKVRESDFEVPEFNFPTRQLARNLGACVTDDPELQGQLPSLLEAQDEDARSQQSTDVQHAIIEVILVLLHKKDSNAIRVDRLADLTNALLRSRGEIVEYSSEDVGWKLRQLGFARHRDAAGKSLYLRAETSRRAHELARSWGTISVQNARQDCQNCVVASQQPV